jgi:hypothetical protein
MLKDAFATRAEIELQRRFKTPEARTAAREVQARAGKLIEQARAYRDERLKTIRKTTQDRPQPALTPRFFGRLFGQHRAAHRQSADHEQTRLHSRTDRILQAKDNQLQRIEDRQKTASQTKPEAAEPAPAKAGAGTDKTTPANDQAATAPPEQAHEPVPAQAAEENSGQDRQDRINAAHERQAEIERDRGNDLGTGREIE